MNTNNFEKNDLRASNPLCGLIFPMSLCHLYALMFYLYVLVCHSYISHMCSYVIRKLLVCTRMLSVYHPYVFLCHPYVTHMYSYVICMSLVCGFTIKVLGETLSPWGEIDHMLHPVLSMSFSRCFWYEFRLPDDSH